jgi:galactose mutarotase-like enzyme
VSMASGEGAARTVRATDAELTVAVELGGRLSSLRDLRSGHEWLAQPPIPARSSRYGGVFTDGDMAGWDEMVPTIVACTAPVADVPLPDHGEAWAVPWEVHDATPTLLRTSVRGRALDYRLTRTIEATGPAAFELRYELTSAEPVPVPVLWAAHPQFVWSPGTRITLDDHVEEVLDVTAPGSPVVAWDEELATWLDAAQQGASRKVWLLPDAAPTRVALTGPQGGLTLTWSPARIPYLGVWYDAEAFARERVVALEPSTGHYDDLAVAAAQDRTQIAVPGEVLRWSLTVSLQPPASTR